MSSLDIKTADEEYINDYSSLIIPSITKTACAFLNTLGGTIILCVRPGNDSTTYPEDVVKQIISIWEKSIVIHDSMDSGISLQKAITTTIDNKELEGNALIFIKISSIYKKTTHAYVNNAKKNNEDIYVRFDASNYKTDIAHLSYDRLAAMKFFPFIKDYNPRYAIEKKELNSLKRKNDVELKTIGELKNDKSNRIFKHLDLEAAMLSLSNGNMRFYEPSNWDDDYECRFYNANYKGNGNTVTEVNAPFLYATCFASNPNNEAAWVLYSHNQTGLASRCVQFELNLKELRKQLVKNAKKVMIVIGEVNYVSSFMINHLHDSQIDGNDNKYYHYYFDSFCLEHYLNLLLLKRTVFEHEKEVRLFIIPNQDSEDSKNKKTRKIGKKKYEGNEKPLYTEIEIDWSLIIEKVRIDKDSSFYEKSILQKKMDALYKRKKKKLISDGVSYDEDKLKSKFTLETFDPYEDKSLKSGPLTIVTK